MNTSFEASGFQVEITKDGSPTLKHQRSGESMHHSAGAASETWYIYGSVIEAVFKEANLQQPVDCIEVCNVGVGLGYIEMVWAILNSEKMTSHLDSFEIIPELQKGLSDWFYDKESTTSEIYNLVWDHLIAIIPQSIKSTDLRKKMQSQQLNLHIDVLLFRENKKWNIICFDAFSNKTDSQLWTSEYLSYFLNAHAAEECVFTTYASTGSLKNALKSKGFKILNRPGFAGKRESTLAVRGTFMNHVFRTF